MSYVYKLTILDVWKNSSSTSILGKKEGGLLLIARLWKREKKWQGKGTLRFFGEKGRVE